MNWTEITITVPQKDTDEAAAIANMTVPYGIYIEDYSQLEKEAWEIAHIDLIDEDLLKEVVTENKELTAAIAEVIKELDLDGKTEYQKVKAIHDYICDNVDYDYEHLSQGDDYPGMFTAYAAMFDGKAICQGYATLFYRMCDEAGILGVWSIGANRDRPVDQNNTVTIRFKKKEIEGE